MDISRSNDPRVKDTIKHLRHLSRRYNHKLTVKDYLEYRAKTANNLPSPTTIYRLFGSWTGALAAAEIDEDSDIELSRTPDNQLIDALQQAAQDLDVKVLSSHAYDDWRCQQPDPKPPSSSVIRKWLGRWADAVTKAGLETSDRISQHKPSMIEIIDALREAKQQTIGMLSQQAYSEYVSSLPKKKQEQYPDAITILSIFPNWQTALRAADVEQTDTLHPSGLWTAEEARRIAQSVEKILGEDISQEGYEKVVARSSKPMPDWNVLSELLKQ